MFLRRVAANIVKRSYAKVTQPAPAFSGTAAVNGAFDQISLENYMTEVGLLLVFGKIGKFIKNKCGKWKITPNWLYLTFYLGKMGMSIFLPVGLHLRLSN